jgi:hypothetical protein
MLEVKDVEVLEVKDEDEQEDDDEDIDNNNPFYYLNGWYPKPGEENDDEPDKPYHIEIRPDAKPYHGRPYSVPKAYERTLKVELDQLVKIGVLKKVNCSNGHFPLSSSLRRITPYDLSMIYVN